MINVVVPGPAVHFDCDRAKLELALQQSGDQNFWIVDDATERVILACAAKHPDKFQSIRGTGDGAPRMLEFARECPAVQVPMSYGMGLALPWSPPGSGRTGGWVASYVRHKHTASPLPFQLELACNTATTCGARCVFASAGVAVAAIKLHGLDINVGDGLFWTVGPPLPRQRL